VKDVFSESVIPYAMRKTLLWVDEVQRIYTSQPATRHSDDLQKLWPSVQLPVRSKVM